MKRATLDAQQLSLSFDEAGPPAADQARGDRSVQVGAMRLIYTLRRARRRSIGFQIDDRGLTVSAPRWVSLRDIEAAVMEKRRWIERKQVEWREWRERQQLGRVRFVEGGAVPYLGRDVVLRLRGQQRKTTFQQHSNAPELLLSLPTHAQETQVRDAVQGWLQGEAHRVLGERLQQLSQRSRVQPASWRLSSARSQWGACTHDGRISLSWRLIHFALPVIDYVVAHELAHLQQMNHGPRFWHVVGQLLPGFEAAREEIKRQDLAALPL